MFKNAGFPAALSLLMRLPLVDVAMIYFLAFAERPSLKKTQGVVSSPNNCSGKEGEPQ